MKEQDRRAVENMSLTGMDLDALCACFPKFPKEEIEKIYNEVKNKPEEKNTVQTQNWGGIVIHRDLHFRYMEKMERSIVLISSGSKCCFVRKKMKNCICMIW